jgi:hypothetical protein
MSSRRIVITEQAYDANLREEATTPSETAAMVLLAIHQELRVPLIDTWERQLYLTMARLWYAMAYLQGIPMGEREEVLREPYRAFKAALRSYEESLRATGDKLPNHPELNDLVATALIGINECLTTGERISIVKLLMVNFRVDAFVQTLSVDPLVHRIVDAMKSVFLKLMVLQGDTRAERKAFMQPELQTFILTLGVIPCVGEFLATLN